MKKALSFVMAVVLMIAMIPTATNTITADAVCTSGTTDLLEFGNYLIEAGSASNWYDTVLVDNGEKGTEDDPIIIDTAEEFVCLTKGVLTDTAGKYYKVADGISAFDLSKGNLNLSGTLADNIDKIKGSGKNHTGTSPGFQGTFDGNGVTVYGAWTNHTEGNIPQYAGLFSITRGDVTIKNINVRLSSFTAKSAAGGIVGYHIGDGTNTLTIENCSVSDCHIEVLGTGWGCGTGGIIGFSNNLSSFKDTQDTDQDGDTTETLYIDGATFIKNCFVNLDEKYFVSPFEQDSQTDTTIRGVHGGVAGYVSSNALSVSDCIVIGITPYATTSCTSYNDVQHSGFPSHFTNVYTDQQAGNAILIGGMDYVATPKDFTGRVTQLTSTQLKGATAIENMDLDWSVWMADDNDYPELRSSHKNISYITNNDGTHSETCICGFGGIKYACVYEDGKCTICKPKAICTKKKTIYWDGYISYGFSDQSLGTKDDPVIINTASELAYLIISNESVSTLADGNPKYFKIADDIGTIVLQDSIFANDILGFETATEVKTFFEKYSGWLYSWPNKGWEQSSFCGNFDGNGAKIYGLYQKSSNNAGLFSSIDAGASIHNIAVMNSYITTTATNYQIGAIAAVGNGIDYGVKQNGVVWFDSCIVANCYMRSRVSDTYAKQRCGIIIGNAYEEAVVIDNCLVYGNDAYYGESYEHKIPLIGIGRNNIHTTSRKPDGLDIKIQTNVNDTGVDMFYNMVRNTVALDCDIVNTRMHYGYRLNEPDCFENCYTDGVSGTVEFSDGSWTYSSNQIMPTTANELKYIYISDAWVTTNTLPELKSFHAFVAVDNGNSTHTLSCDCGVTGVPDGHIFSEAVKETIVTPTCTTNGSYALVYRCSECPAEVYRETINVDATGHTYEDDIVTQCSACGETRVAFIHGDANSDNIINGRDYTLITQHINGWDINILYEACDVDRDGKINGKDVAIIIQYLNGWDVCIHRYTAATCTSPKSCIHCDQTIGAKLGHDYVLGECTRVNKGELCGDYNAEYCPKLYFTGDMSQMTDKKDVRGITFEYKSYDQHLTGAAKIKVQGTSSLQYDKKNYTINFYEDEDYLNKLGVNVGWGAQDEYCLKANWIDKTHSRNVVTAKLASELQAKYGLFETAPNNGVIDGFPIEVYINGSFHGLYTMNIPKADWMFAMDENNPDHIVICGENWNDPVLFRAEPNLSDWSVEVGPETQETLQKINRLYTFIHDSSDDEFVANFDQYLNLDSTLNYYIMLDYGWMPDNSGKNMLLATYDGNVWYPTLYDLDTTWGAHWQGTSLYNYENSLMSMSRSLLWERVEKLFKNELAQRYFDLRQDVLDKEHVMATFNAFYNSIPQEILDREMEKWGPNIPGFDLTQIQHYLDSVVYRLDNKYYSWYRSY